MKVKLLAALMSAGLVAETQAQVCHTHSTHVANAVSTYVAPYQQTLVLPVATFFPVYGAPYYGAGAQPQAQQAEKQDAVEKRLATLEDNVGKLTTNMTQLTAAITALNESLAKKKGE